MRIQCPENLRVPLQGSSVGGESGPKARPSGVVDGKQVNIPVLIFVGTEGRRKLNWVCLWYGSGSVQGVERSKKNES